jgi:hypothetical protein
MGTRRLQASTKLSASFFINPAAKSAFDGIISESAQLKIRRLALLAV